MANLFKQKSSSNVHNFANVGDYSVPTGCVATVIGMTLCNMGNTGVTVDVQVNRGLQAPSVANINILKDAPIPVGGSLVVVGGDQKVVLEVIKLINERRGVPGDMIVEKLKTKLNLVVIPMKKIEDSVWGQLTKDERLGQSVQGFRQSTDENGKKVRVPHVGFSADLDYLDEFVNRLVKKIEGIKNK